MNLLLESITFKSTGNLIPQAHIISLDGSLLSTGPIDQTDCLRFPWAFNNSDQTGHLLESCFRHDDPGSDLVKPAGWKDDKGNWADLRDLKLSECNCYPDLLLIAFYYFTKRFCTKGTGLGFWCLTAFTFHLWHFDFDFDFESATTNIRPGSKKSISCLIDS